MIVYTAHLRPRAEPVLVPEAFSVAALILGPIWLLAHRAWIGGVLALLAWVVLALVPGAGAILVLALHWTLGLWGQDVRRWSLARQGYLLAHIVAAPDRDAALARLLARRPDLVSDLSVLP